MAIRPQRGEGRLHNYNYWQYLGGEVGSVWGGGGGGGGGELSCFGGKLPPSLDEILLTKLNLMQIESNFV